MMLQLAASYHGKNNADVGNVANNFAQIAKAEQLENCHCWAAAGWSFASLAEEVGDWVGNPPPSCMYPHVSELVDTRVALWCNSRDGRGHVLRCVCRGGTNKKTDR